MNRVPAGRIFVTRLWHSQNYDIPCFSGKSLMKLRIHFTHNQKPIETSCTWTDRCKQRIPPCVPWNRHLSTHQVTWLLRDCTLPPRGKANWTEGDSLLLNHLYKENVSVIKGDFEVDIAVSVIILLIVGSGTSMWSYLHYCILQVTTIRDVIIILIF